MKNMFVSTFKTYIYNRLEGLTIADRLYRLVENLDFFKFPTFFLSKSFQIIPTKSGSAVYGSGRGG